MKDCAVALSTSHPSDSMTGLARATRYTLASRAAHGVMHRLVSADFTCLLEVSCWQAALW